jgi:hypothetical protein
VGSRAGVVAVSPVMATMDAKSARVT